MNVWVYIGQMVEHCNANSEAMGSNPVKVPIFFPVYLQIAKNLITTATIISSFKKMDRLSEKPSGRLCIS